MNQFTPHAFPRLKVDYEKDDLDSARDVIRLIADTPESLSHPQGPLTIATINVVAFAPHNEIPMAIARLLAAAPSLLAALERLRQCPDVNLDELEPETMEALKQADNALAGQSNPLIAAAPDLLAALESLIDSASWTPTDNWRIGPMGSSKGGKMDMARRAIAKAKGSQ